MLEAGFKILVIEDDDTMREGLVRTLKRMGHTVAEADNGTQGSALLESGPFDLVIADYKLEGMNGLELIEKAKAIDPGLDVILITAFGTIDIAVEAIKKGATDFIAKPFALDEFRHRVEQALHSRSLRRDNVQLKEENLLLRLELEDVARPREINSQSPKMKEIFDTIAKIAPTTSTVLIFGESGTGKELVARAIHQQSHRKGEPFVKVNCGALAEGVLDSELFGHEKGAFTDAIRRKMGRFELANGGTIFLDEIGEIALSTQVKLLRVLQEKEFERVGGEETLRVDVRVIAATNRDLLSMVKDGRFREDLYYRLHVIPVHLPALRERKEDIPLLARCFVEKTRKEMNLPPIEISEKAMARLEEYLWPGNIRELENVIERAVVLCDGKRVEAKDLPLLSNDADVHLRLPSQDMPLDAALENLEKQLIESALEKAGGTKTQAAKILGIKTSTLYYKLEKYNLLSKITGE
jgi:two-component system response regulator HydG